MPVGGVETSSSPCPAAQLCTAFAAFRPSRAAFDTPLWQACSGALRFVTALAPAPCLWSGGLGTQPRRVVGTARLQACRLAGSQASGGFPSPAYPACVPRGFGVGPRPCPRSEPPLATGVPPTLAAPRQYAPMAAAVDSGGRRT